MRLYALIALIFPWIFRVQAVLSDEAFNVDFHQALLGIPLAENTFFHRPSASSSASLLYTISGKAILGAVNPKDGSVVWRQALGRSSPKPQLFFDGVDKLSGREQQKTSLTTGPVKSGLLAEEGHGAVFSYHASTVSAWDASSGRLVWQKEMPHAQHVRSAILLSSDRATHESSTPDVVVLYGQEKGIIARLDGSTGVVKWEHVDSSGGLPDFLASADKRIYYSSEQSAVLGAGSVKHVSLAIEDGREIKTSSAKIESILTTCSCPTLAFTSWFERSSKSVKVNLFGSSKIYTLSVESNGKDGIEKLDILPSCGPKGTVTFLVHIQTSYGGWAEVFHLSSEPTDIKKVYTLPYLKGKDTFAVSQVNDNIYFTRSTDSNIELYAATSKSVLATWSRSQPLFGGPHHSKAEVVVRGKSEFAIRIAEVSGSGEWTLTRNDQMVWSRPEMLANVVAATWADDLSVEALAQELDLEGHENPLSAYAHRVKRHVRDLEYLPAWLQELPSNFLSGLLSSKSEAEKGLLGNKFLVVATSAGEHLALDPAKGGAIKWKKPAPEKFKEVRDISLVVRDGIVTSFIDSYGILTLNATDGRTMSHNPVKANFTKLAIVPGPTAPIAYRFPADGHPESIVPNNVAINGTYIVSQPPSGSGVQGWTVGRSDHQLWTFSRGPEYRVANVIGRPLHDPVSSIAKVLADRSVLYKYLSQNLLLITSITSDVLAVDLIDAITGTVLFSTTHHDVDTGSPIPSAISENWFTYSFFGRGSPDSPSAKSQQLVMVELYESPIPNDRGPLGSQGNYSSFDTLTNHRPHIIAQSFTLAYPVSHISITQTAQGISSRQLLCTLPSLHAIVAIPRHLLDPRRPTDRDPTAAESSEEGLYARYSPVLDLDPRTFLTHARDVWDVRAIVTAPTRLESTGLVFAFGLDVFGTRVTPSRAFDVLGKGFNKIALVGTVVALGVGTLALAPIVGRKTVERVWRL